jgi:hypothetical protein
MKLNAAVCLKKQDARVCSYTREEKENRKEKMTGLVLQLEKN